MSAAVAPARRRTAATAELRRQFVGSADLVLAGGGVKGIGHVGAIAVLEESGYDRFQRVIGTSVGAVVGALVAAGTPADELERILMGFDFGRLRDRGAIDRVPGVGKPLSMLFERGVYEGDAVRDWVHGRLVERGAETFAKIKQRASERLGRQLAAREWPFEVLTTDVTRGRLVRLPTDYGDYDCRPGPQYVADAVRASLSIPIFFEPFPLGGSNLVDGGVLSNFAIEAFDAEDPANARWPTFGMTLLGDGESPVLGRDLLRSLLPLPGWADPPLVGFLEDLIGAMVVGQDQHKLGRRGVAQRTIRIDTDAVGIVDFDIDQPGKRGLIAQGRRAGRRFIDAWRGDDGRPGAGRFPIPTRKGPR
jgi:NTE family protein